MQAAGGPRGGAQLGSGADASAGGGREEHRLCRRLGAGPRARPHPRTPFLATVHSSAGCRSGARDALLPRSSNGIWSQCRSLGHIRGMWARSAVYGITEPLHGRCQRSRSYRCYTRALHWKASGTAGRCASVHTALYPDSGVCSASALRALMLAPLEGWTYGAQVGSLHIHLRNALALALAVQRKSSRLLHVCLARVCHAVPRCAMLC